MSMHASVTRRRFLRNAATLAAAPYVLSYPSWGKAAPSARVNLGMIGVGNMGGGHLSGLVSHNEVQIVAICDVMQHEREEALKVVTEAYTDKAGREYKGCDLYNEYEQLLARPDIDAVLIAVPDHWHATIAIAACRAGKDVYCEKPLALTIREADQMVAAARRYGRVLQTGSQQRSESNFRLACELVRSGRIGRLVQVNVGIGAPSQEKYLPEEPLPDGIDWDRWLGPSPWYPYNSERCSGDYGGGWRFIRETSGGMMTDWGAHHFDIAQWGMGMDGHGPVEIIAPELEPVERGKPSFLGKVKPGKPLTYKYANGVIMQHGGANGILFTGTDGKIEVNRGYFRTWPDKIGKEPLGPKDVHLYESPGHFQDFLNCMRTRQRPICDVAIGASSVTVCHLGNIAWWLGRSLKWDPATHEIIGDAEAARWLDRPKRAPYRLHA